MGIRFIGAIIRRLLRRLGDLRVRPPRNSLWGLGLASGSGSFDCGCCLHLGRKEQSSLRMTYPSSLH